MYVDDLVVAYSGERIRKYVWEQLSKSFNLKDLGPLQWCLGMRVKHEDGIVTLDQEQYSKSIVDLLALSDCNPVPTPLIHGHELTREMSPKTEEERRIVAQFPYLTVVCTRPDLAVFATTMSRFAKDPGLPHIQVMKRCVRYLKGSAAFSLKFRKAPNQPHSPLQPTINGNDINCFTDASWAGCIETRKSVSGMLVYVFGNLVVWSSKQQSIVAHSTFQAELIALDSGVREVVWERRFLGELGYIQSHPTVIWNDNMATISSAYNPSVSHERNKHIDIRYRYTAQMVSEGVCDIKYIGTKQMVADMLTKPLPPIAFKFFSDIL